MRWPLVLTHDPSSALPALRLSVMRHCLQTPIVGIGLGSCPRSIDSKLDRVCVKCGFQAPLEGWAEQGTVEKLTHEEQERRSAALLFSLGLGPKPISEKRKLPQRIREFWLGSPEPVDPSEQYPLIKIANEVD